MPGPEGFDYEVVGGTVTITHHGRRATVLRGRRAEQFLDDVERDDPQELMARLTGNYKRGNERQARNHPRNRGSGRPPAVAPSWNQQVASDAGVLAADAVGFALVCSL